MSEATQNKDEVVLELLQKKGQEVIEKGSTEEYIEKYDAKERLDDKEVVLMFDMLKAYMKGQYKQVPALTLAAIVGALVYLVSPVDVAPDAIPVAGLLDDAFVCSLVYGAIKSDINDYTDWVCSLNKQYAEEKSLDSALDKLSNLG